MLNELLQDRSALYVSGTMTARERDEFELILEFHAELRQFVQGLEEVGNALLLSDLPTGASGPSAQLKARILQAVAEQPAQASPTGFVTTGPDGLVQWVNPAFVAMCGYSLDELRGKTLGPLLQGEKTDLAAAARMRQAVRDYKPCHETMINYRKDGSVYGVDISITPILNDEGVPLWMVAREHEVALPLAA